MATSTGTGNYPDVVQANDANDAAVIATGHTVTLTGNVTGNNYFKIYRSSHPLHLLRINKTSQICPVSRCIYTKPSYWCS